MTVVDIVVVVVMLMLSSSNLHLSHLIILSPSILSVSFITFAVARSLFIYIKIVVLAVVVVVVYIIIIIIIITIIIMHVIIVMQLMSSSSSLVFLKLFLLWRTIPSVNRCGCCVLELLLEVISV